MSRVKRKPLNTPYNEPPTISELMNEVMNRRRFSFRLSRMLLPRKWAKIAGESIARNTRPVKIEKKKLILNVSNAAWMNELCYLKDDLIEKINTMAGGALIEDIVMRVGRSKFIETEQTLEKKQTVEELPSPEADELSKAEEMASRIRNSSLRQTIKEIYLRSLLRRRMKSSLKA